MPDRAGGPRADRKRGGRWARDAAAGSALRLALPLSLMLASALASDRPLPVDLSHGSDKLVHAAAYALLAASWLPALAGSSLGMLGRLATAAGLAILWGGMDELHQSLVPGRDASWGDLAADSAGALLLALGVALLARRGRG